MKKISIMTVCIMLITQSVHHIKAFEVEMTSPVIIHGGESEIDKQQEKINETMAQKNEPQSTNASTSQPESTKIITTTNENNQSLQLNSNENIQFLEANSSQAPAILTQTAVQMGLDPSSTTMQNIIAQWNDMAKMYTGTSIPTDTVNDFLQNMSVTIKKSLN